MDRKKLLFSQNVVIDQRLLYNNMISELPSGNNFLTHIGSVLLQKLFDVLSVTPFRQKTNKLIRQHSGGAMVIGERKAPSKLPLSVLAPRTYRYYVLYDNFRHELFLAKSQSVTIWEIKSLPTTFLVYVYKTYKQQYYP